MTKYLSALLTGFVQLNPLVTAGLALGTFLLAVVNFTNEMWGTLVAKMATLVLPAGIAGPVLSGLSFINYFFPVEELFTFVSAYVAVYGLCALIRVVKSFIPTMA